MSILESLDTQEEKELFQQQKQESYDFIRKKEKKFSIEELLKRSLQRDI